MDLILKSEIIEVKQKLISVVLNIQSGESLRDPMKLGLQVEEVIKRLDEIEPK